MTPNKTAAGGPVPGQVPAQVVTDSRPTDSLIPDGCNIGVVFRALLAANAAVLAGCLLAVDAWPAGLQRFVESTMLLELTVLTSLLALCGLRRALPAAPPWQQRLLCSAAPGIITAMLVVLLQSGAGVFGSLTRLSVIEGLLCGAGAGALLGHYFELRLRAFSPALAEARLQALQARIQPHFLFNSLNAVLSMIRSEPKRAETTLEDLAELFRALMRDARDVITLEDEIRLCKQYLAIEQVRLGERLQVQWEMADLGEEVLRRARVPALLLQPLLENAVHYGVEPASAPATVRIQLTRSLDRIEIVITNPLPASSDVAGDAAFEGNHMALENIRERLLLFYDVEAALTTERSAGQFEVRLRFPYVKGT
jgi:two-component system sensor histidine kinase AlgZ